VRAAVEFQPQRAAAKQAVPGDVPEGLVAARQAADEAVFDLLLAPQLGKGGALAGVTAARPAGPPRDVEERAEGIERDGLDAGLLRHAGDLVADGVVVVLEVPAGRARWHPRSCLFYCNAAKFIQCIKKKKP
jgi:hypothetical protein